MRRLLADADMRRWFDFRRLHVMSAFNERVSGRTGPGMTRAVRFWELGSGIGGSVRFAQVEDQSRCVSSGITLSSFRSPIFVSLRSGNNRSAHAQIVQFGAALVTSSSPTIRVSGYPGPPVGWAACRCQML